MSAPVPCRYVSWNACYHLARDLALAVRRSRFDPEVIVAIARGGCPPARVVSDYLGQPNVMTVKIEHYDQLHKRDRAVVRYPLPADVSGLRVLVVDDVNDTGESLKLALEHIRGLSAPAELRTAVLHHKTVSAFRPDYAARRIVTWCWVIYPWAVIEDLTSLIGRMQDRPPDPATLRERLLRDHKVRLSLGEVAYALGMVERKEGWLRTAAATD